MQQRSGGSQFIGRETELEAILRAARAASAGEPRVVVVTGEAGIGKTRLLREATHRLDAEGYRVLVGGCLDIGDGGLPYLPIAQALRGLARDTPALEFRRLIGPAQDDVERIVPGLLPTPDAEATHDSAHSTTLAESGYGQARFFERFLGLLGRLGESAPTLLVVEDIHWIDRATRDLLTFVLANLTHERVAIGLTSRVDDLPRGHSLLAWLGDLGRSPRTEWVDLARLDRADVVRQVQVLAGRLPHEDVVEGIWRRSEGVPLFVEELSAALSATLAHDRTEHIVQILLARVEGSTAGCRQVLGSVAVAGRAVDEGLLAEVLDHPADALRPWLREALERGAIVVDDAAGRVRFRHELLREAMEGELLATEIRALHERFAIALQRRQRGATGPADPSGSADVTSELAYHWAAADRVPEAYRASIDAGQAAVGIHAYVLAHQQLERALGLETRLPVGVSVSAADRIELRSLAADAADLGGDPARALALTQEALALVDVAADPRSAGMFSSRIGYLLWLSGDSAAALVAHRRAVELVPPEPSRERARVLGALGGALMGLGRWTESREVCEAAIECAALAGATAEESRARNMLGSDLVALGEVDAGVDQLRHACRLATSTGIIELVIVGHHNLALNLLQADRFEDALLAATDGRADAHEFGLERRFGQDLAALHTDILLRLGRWDAAGVASMEGLALDPRGIGTTYLSAVRARLLALRGEVAEARDRIAAVDRASLEPDVAAYLASIAAEAALVENRPVDALAAVGRGLSALDGLQDVLWTAPLIGIGLRAAADQAELARASRDEPALADARTAASAMADRVAWLEERATTRGTRAWLVMARAEWRRLEGGADAAADWSAAIDAWDALPDVFAAAYARLRRAESSLRRWGTRAPVGDDLVAAHEAAVSMGAAPLRRRIESLATRARVMLPRTGTDIDADPGARTDPDAGIQAARALGLSMREVEVLLLVAAGRTNGEIADRLFISRKTAAVHVTHILDKLGVANRVEAAMVAVQIGLVSDGGPSSTAGPS